MIKSVASARRPVCGGHFVNTINIKFSPNIISCEESLFLSARHDAGLSIVVIQAFVRGLVPAPEVQVEREVYHYFVY